MSARHSRTLAETLVDSAPLPDAVLAMRQAEAALAYALHALGDRERQIIEARFLSNEGSSLRQLGTRFGITRERVRQIEARALEKLRGILERAGIGPDAIAA